ncbi:unnamed protein product [Vicia faba]|uniref:Uncharacterized protein n=1 Tax=Vicia faba TaxID=3906 RepID=A0AAV1ARQ4_VICFA|nr:unnamed protein product [Vicia faba]
MDETKIKKDTWATNQNVEYIDESDVFDRIWHFRRFYSSVLFYGGRSMVEATEILEKEEDDFEQLAKNPASVPPIEIMDKALEKFGNDIVIAFKLIILLNSLVRFSV